MMFHLHRVAWLIIMIIFPTLWDLSNSDVCVSTLQTDSLQITTKSEILAPHSSFRPAEPVQHHTVQSWHHMECGCRLEIKSSGTNLSCWAQMHCSSPHTAWLTATVHSRIIVYYLQGAHANSAQLCSSSSSLSAFISVQLPPPTLCVLQWRAQTPVRDDNYSPDDATEKEARGHS